MDGCWVPLNIKNVFNGGIISASNRYVSVSGVAGEIVGGIAGYGVNVEAINCYNKGEIKFSRYNTGGIIGETGGTNSNFLNCYNMGNIYAKDGCAGGINGEAGSNSIFLNCHNTGSIASDPTSTNSGRTKLGEIYGLYYSSATVENCTFLNKETNANSNGATGKDNMDDTMSLSNFVTLMNSYVTENNNDPTKEKLNTWTLKDGVPVFAK